MKIRDCDATLNRLETDERTFKILFENSPDGILLLSEERFVDCNRAAVEMLGLAHRSDLLDLRPEDISPAMQPDGLNSPIKIQTMVRKAKTEGSARFDWVFKRIDETPVCVEANLTRVPSEQETVLFMMRREMSDREELKVKEAYWEELFENLPEAIVVLDNNDHVRQVNSEFSRLFGYNQEESRGRLVNDLIVPEHLKTEGLEFTRQASLGKRVEVETVRCRKDGTLVHVSVLGTPIRTEGGQIGVFGIYRDISVRKRAQEALERNEEKYGTILEEIEDGYYEVDLAGIFSYVTNVAARIMGLDKKDLIGRKFSEFSDSVNTSFLRDVFYEVFASGHPIKQVGYEITAGQEGRKTLEASASLIRDSDGSPVGFRGIIRDMTSRRQAEEALRESEERHRVVLEAAPDPMVVFDMKGVVTYINPAFTRVFGWTLEECAGRRLGLVSDSGLSLHEDIAQRISRGEFFTGIETKTRTKDGRSVDVSISGAAFPGTDGRPLGSVITLQDITLRKRTEEEITYIAFHDILTGLPNRKSFYNRMVDELDQSKRRGPGYTWALLFLDLDRFKYINDSLGHEVGDKLLKAVASRIQICLRKSDYIFRLGGDEFTVILSNISRDLDVAKVAAKIREAVSRPFSIKGHQIYVTVSIGISLYPMDGQEVEVLVKNADMAMYAAKEEREGYRFFTEEMNLKALERMKMESSLRTALERNEFVLFYQPLVNCERRVIGMEALIRWQQPEMGLVQPGQFIPLAEETGSIVQIGEWVLRTACEQAKKWEEMGFLDLYMAVNVSSRQFGDSGFVDRVLTILNQTGLDPARLKLELTESSVMLDPEGTIIKMKLLRDRGIRFSIDDFGTGYSSLSYLKRFPIDTLKIDRSFVRDSAKNRDDQEIIKTIITMAKTLSIETIAEGVESEAQQAFLTSQGCRLMQGYFFGHPMAGEAFLDLLKKSNGQGQRLSCALPLV